MGPAPDNFSSVEDFLENEAFRTWMLERRERDQLHWQAWLAQYPQKRELYEQAVAAFLVIQGKISDLPDWQVKVRTAQMINQLPDSFPVQVRSAGWQWGRWLTAAAVVILIVCWQLNKLAVPPKAVADTRQERTAPGAEWKIVWNQTTQPFVVLLPDNSSVLLSAKSQLRYRDWTNRPTREVFLEGEGFFEVSKNPAKPFLVYAHHLTTRVVGTSFQVRSFDNEPKAFVRVKTGKVTVTPFARPKKAIDITVNEQVQLEARTEQVVKQASSAALDPSTPLITQPYVFHYTPVPAVLEQLETAYHMPIRYDRKLLSNCTFTGQLDDVPFLEKIRLLCLTIDSTYELVDNQVIIHSNGCL